MGKNACLIYKFGKQKCCKCCNNIIQYRSFAYSVNMILGVLFAAVALIAEVKSESVSRSSLCNPMDLYSPSGSSPWNSPGKNTRSHPLLEQIFWTQGPNPGLLYYRQILYHLSHLGSPD